LFDIPKEALGGISQILALGQPASLNAIEIIYSFGGLLAAASRVFAACNT
jgi:hypothetical protein